MIYEHCGLMGLWGEASEFLKNKTARGLMKMSPPSPTKERHRALT